MSNYLEKSWGHCPFVPPDTALYGGMHTGFDVHIVLLSVNDGSMKLEWISCCDADIDSYRVTVARRGESVGFANNAPAGLPPPQHMPASVTQCAFRGLLNGVDYEVTVRALGVEGKQVGRSLNRLFRCGYFPGTVVNYIHPDDYTFAFSGRSPASPFILHLPSGTLLVSHDVYWQESGQNLSFLFCSQDGGESWNYLTDLCPCYWGKMFYHNGKVYMMGLDSEYGSYLIGCSEDEGRSWSKPVKLLPGGDIYTGGPHQAPTPVAFHRGRVWTAVEWGAWKLGYHKSGILSASLDSDLLNPASWTVSPYIEQNPDWHGAVKGGNPAILEGNIFVMPNGQLGNLLRYHTRGADPEYGVAVLLSLDPDHPDQPQRFVRTVALEGNYTKFFLGHDPQTNYYFLLCNRPDPGHPGRRDILSLAASPDGEEWQVLTDLLNYRDNNWSETPEKTALQYPAWIADGGDMLAVVRTAMNGAWNYHNANAITFHRFADFRSELYRKFPITKGDCAR